MDQVVHINNGSDAARPIILRLLPGEETIFELKVVNHGEPSDLTLEASDPVFKAVRFRRPDNHVTKEVIIPIMARMPANKKRLDGEILLTSNAGESRVPISLLRDSEDADRDGEEDQRVDAYDVGDDDSDAYYNADDDADDKPVRKSERYGDDAEDDEDAEEGDDFDAVEKVRYLDAEEAGKEPRRIVFSRDRDLERYRSASRQKAEDDPDEVAESVRSQRRTKIIIARGIGRDMEDGIDERTDEDIEDNIGNRPDRHITPRFNSRIDDRFVDRNPEQDEALVTNPWEGRPLESTDADGKDFLKTFQLTIKTFHLNRIARAVGGRMAERKVGAEKREMSGKSPTHRSRIRERLLGMRATWIRTVTIMTGQFQSLWTRADNPDRHISGSFDRFGLDVHHLYHP